MRQPPSRTLTTLYETLRVKRGVYLGAVERKNTELAAFEEAAIHRLDEAIRRIEQAQQVMGDGPWTSTS